MDSRTTHKIAAFYQFSDCHDSNSLASELRQLGEQHQLRGTIILAQEGINSTVAGLPADIDCLLDFLRQEQFFPGLEVKISWADFQPFPRFKVRLKPEIVTFRQPTANPGQGVGTYVEPEDWNDLISSPDVITIDTRNSYEVEIGKFNQAIDPQTNDFTSFADYVQKHKAQLDGKRVAMYCTGGIRCEKATAYLKQQGINDVSHLKGGILNYLEKVPRSQSLWQGDCFVFDYRVAVNHDLRPADWKINPQTGDPEPMLPEEREIIAKRRRTGEIYRDQRHEQ